MNDYNDSDSENILYFATLDLTGVDFDQRGGDHEEQHDAYALGLETLFLSGNKLEEESRECSEESQQLFKLASLVWNGKYADALNGKTSKWLLADSSNEMSDANFFNMIRMQLSNLKSVS
jgi:hypothetical protein